MALMILFFVVVIIAGSLPDGWLYSYIIYCICVCGLSIALIGSGISAIVLNGKMNEDFMDGSGISAIVLNEKMMEDFKKMGGFAIACGLIDILVGIAFPFIFLLY